MYLRIESALSDQLARIYIDLKDVTISLVFRIVRRLCWKCIVWIVSGYFPGTTYLSEAIDSRVVTT